MTATEKLQRLKSIIMEQKNDHCFIEKERFLQYISPDEDKTWDYYPRLFSGLLSSVSTPVDEADIFVGRVVEDAPDGEMQCPSRILMAKGHLTPDYEKLLKEGYRGILRHIHERASTLHTKEAYRYAENATICVDAIHCYAMRYAQAAKKAGNLRAWEALLRVPYEPAWDLYSALQSVWLVHMISSCYVGYRDYGFGYMDEYLYPFYQMEKKKGTTDQEIVALLAGFLIKANEICGRGTHNYRQKPVLCQASKQYVLLDGGKANDLSKLILDAAVLSGMAQPEITVVLDDRADSAFQNRLFTSMAAIPDKVQIYNNGLLQNFLREKSLPEHVCQRPAFTACCTADIYRHSCREEFYLPCVQIFCQVLSGGVYKDKLSFLDAYAQAITGACEEYLQESREPDPDWARCVYMLDCLLLGTCNEECEYPPKALRYRAKNIFLTGIATLADSLTALDTLVFQGDVAYETLVQALNRNFEGEEELLQRLRDLPKFGNDLPTDRYAAEIGSVLVRAVEQAEHRENEIVMPSFYSLERDNTWVNIPATPDGRCAGDPISENQSPTYGADKSGITALLNSLSVLPFARTAGGGLNLSFSARPKPEILQALVKTYFQKGGLHIGISVLERQAMLDAMEHPERYPTLTVRLYGFSEYFVSLPRWQQLAVLNRTVY